MQKTKSSRFNPAYFNIFWPIRCWKSILFFFCEYLRILLKKGTLLSKLMCEYSDLLEMSVSWTTRKKRDGEREGVSYFFKTMEEFEQVYISFDF